MERRRFLKIVTCLPLFGFYPVARIGSQDVPRFDTRTIELLKSKVAGFRYYRGEMIWSRISPGDLVVLKREPSNPHDRKAVALYWQGEKLGYIPKIDNAVIANLLDQGAAVNARITRKVQAQNPWERLEVTVELNG